jgi:hypothetical protein
MPIATNTFTVTVADAHSHSVSEANIAASNKLEALQQFFEAAICEPSVYSAFTTTDTWTVTVTQP